MNKSVAIALTLQSFIALARQSNVAIIHKDLPIDTTVTGRDVSLAIFLLGDSEPMTSHHFIGRHSVQRLGAHKEITFVDGRRLVAAVKSEHYLYAAVAAIPSATPARNWLHAIRARS